MTLRGFAEWHVAIYAAQPEIDVEFALKDDEALQLIISSHRPKAWNEFIWQNWQWNRSRISKRRLLQFGILACVFDGKIFAGSEDAAFLARGGPRSCY